MLNHVLALLNDYALAYNRDEARYSFISANIAELSGHAVDDFSKNAGLWCSIIDPRDKDMVTAVTDKLTSGNHTNLTYRIITTRGKIKWVNEKRSLFTDEHTGQEILLSIIKDVEHEEEERYDTEESLAEYSILFNNNPNPMWIYEVPTLRILKINEAAVKTYGYTEEEFLKMTIRDIRPESDYEKFDNFIHDKGIAQAKFHGFNQSGIWKHVSKTGEIIYADVTGDSLMFKNYDCRIIVATNITERVHYQEEVKLREQFLNSLIDSQTNFLIRIDINGLFTFVNKRFLKIFGYKNNEIIGKHFKLVTIPEEVHLCETTFSNCISNPGKIITLSHKKISKDGTLYDTEWEFIAITDENGKVNGVQGVGQDITERINAQKEIIWTKSNLEALINNTEDLIWSIDREFRYLYMNQAYRNAIFAYSGIIPVKGGSVYMEDVFDKKTLEEWEAYYERAFKGERYSATNESIDPDTGQLVCFEISFNPIYNEDGKLTGVGCFAHNITTRIKTSKAIIDQNDRLRNIASLSSHELRKPVATMLGLINLIDRENFYNPENMEIIERLLIVGSEIDDVIRLIVDKSFTSSFNN